MTTREYEELCRKKHYLLSGIHPDTGEVIPWFARTSAVLATSIPTYAAMMLTKPTLTNTVFW